MPPVFYRFSTERIKLPNLESSAVSAEEKPQGEGAQRRPPGLFSSAPSALRHYASRLQIIRPHMQSRYAWILIGSFLHSAPFQSGASKEEHNLLCVQSA
jgi:hypothetical protein